MGTLKRAGNSGKEGYTPEEEAQILAEWEANKNTPRPVTKPIQETITELETRIEELEKRLGNATTY